MTVENSSKSTQGTSEAPEVVEKELVEEESEGEKGIGKKKLSSFFSRRIEELESKVAKYEAQEKTLKDELNKKFLSAISKKSEEAIKLIQEKERELERKYLEKFEEQKKFIYESQLSELVDIVARLEGVVKSASGNREVQNYLAGFRLFLTQFEQLFSSWNIAEIVPRLHQEFDSEVMESLETTPVNEDSLKNKVVHIFSKGYKLHDRVIKLAQVRVGI
ncbi:nucleotide exchange factor GrpE [Candidatus Mycoplasma haematominutum]|uniref:Protein GrpE n=1 Tax=Candidatus Mycoplasma haematominutum 'Birmingham 1' TaxID=1116213 RepID=G8C364_9MOLU|nr:nucleotide exchange factor GrpE [Candidatus Mycoplasma haematominutum]CCE66762.1 heat shock protein GrpE [Candidatus Mycoplasma haematominutum 'Birmingham 1']